VAAKSARERALARAKKRPLMAGRESAVHSQNLTRLVREGALERVARGTYRAADAPVSEVHAFAIVGTIAPHSVICLLSALAFHGVGTQLPFEVWVAIERGSRPPALRNPPLRVVRMSGESFKAGIEVNVIEGRNVRIYSVAKTIADLFKFRKRIGIDVAIEALRDAWQRRLVTVDEIDRYARVCRVDRVMRPYLEALLG
jgi:predicted transcriptional regulator of viral defense system